MPNSSIIKKVKNKVIRELIKDKEIVNAINSSDVSPSTPEKLINTHIFDFNQNPNTINKVGTFITVQVQIPYTFYKNPTIHVHPNIEICIVSHEKHMVVDNVPKVTQNRNDYISELIDRKLNGRSGFGIGRTRLQSNLEGAFQHDYLYRKITLECIDINYSLCEEDYNGEYIE